MLSEQELWESASSPREKLNDLDAWRDYLIDRLGIKSEQCLKYRQFPGGYSNLTYLLRLGEQYLVLRLPPKGVSSGSAHDMSREFKVLNLVRNAGFLKCPEPLLYSDACGFSESSFFVMRPVVGEILRAPLASGYDHKLFRARQEQSMELFAELHRIPTEDMHSLASEENYVERQVAGWSKRYRKARTADAPDAEELMEKLDKLKPSSSSLRTLVHNDYKLDNLVFSSAFPSQVAAVLDWEMATLGDPIMDLACSMAYWVERSDPESVQAFASLPSLEPASLSRSELIAIYESASGCKLEAWEFYYGFGLFRLAVIAQQIYARYCLGLTKDPRFAALIHGVRALEKAALRALGS